MSLNLIKSRWLVFRKKMILSFAFFVLDKKEVFMRYDKLKLKDSKQSYESAKDLSSKNKKLRSAEKFLWKILGFFAFLAFFFVTKPGGEASVQEVLFSLAVSGVILSPASIFTIIRVFMDKLISNKYKKGQYYVKYENQIYDVKTRWEKAIDRLADIANSDSKNVKDDLISVAKNMEKVSEELDKEYDLSPEQEREVIKYITKSAEHNINTIKKLSEAQKKQFMQEFKESLYDR